MQSVSHYDLLNFSGIQFQEVKVQCYGRKLSGEIETQIAHIRYIKTHFPTFCLVFFVLKSLLAIARQWSLQQFAILTLKPRSRVRILIYLDLSMSCAVI